MFQVWCNPLPCQNSMQSRRLRRCTIVHVKIVVVVDDDDDDDDDDEGV
jgi:hypothetical protein